jgi:transaldolase
VASFFVSRVDTETDKRLGEIPGYEHLKGRLAVENARLAYEAYLHTFTGPEWEFLEAKEAKRQWPLWASTSTKNPEYSDLKYVEELTAPDTINTMPPETLDAFLDHGEVRGNALEENLEGARGFFDQLREAGIDYYDVTRTLEREGVQKFADSYHELLNEIQSEGQRLARA